MPLSRVILKHPHKLLPIVLDYRLASPARSWVGPRGSTTLIAVHALYPLDEELFKVIGELPPEFAHVVLLVLERLYACII